jgi:hypothetical protein
VVSTCTVKSELLRVSVLYPAKSPGFKIYIQIHTALNRSSAGLVWLDSTRDGGSGVHLPFSVLDTCVICVRSFVVQ